MLALRRRAGEVVLIGDDIEIELLSVTPQGAKIGLRAPRETVVLRKELKITWDQNMRAAAGSAAGGFQERHQKTARRRSRTEAPPR